MALIGPKRTMECAFVVFGFWGFIMAVTFNDGHFDLAFIVVITIFLSIGFWYAGEESKTFRAANYRYLGSYQDIGIKSSLGPVPIHFRLPALPLAFNSAEIIKQYPQELREQNFDFLTQYRELFQNSYPQYVLLVEQILVLLSLPEYVNLPASWAVDQTNGGQVANTNEKSHGNRSLLTHSLLVAGLSMLEAPTFAKSYAPQKIKRAQDPKFKPNADDPLIGLLGIAHDLGKLISYKKIVSQDGNIVAHKVQRHHDALGPVALSKLPAFWNADINSVDRSIILNILGIYHHPQGLSIIPVSETSPTEKNVSDREVALLELLIKADRMAGAVECGQNYKAARINAEATFDLEVNKVQEQNFEGWLDAFLRYTTTNHILDPVNGRSVAFKTVLQERSYLIFDEVLFFQDFVAHIKRPDFLELKPVGNNPNPIISNLLQHLDPLGVLYRPDTKLLTGKNPELAIYRVAFFDPKKDPNVPTFVINSAFVLDITEWEELSIFKSKNNCHSNPVFLNCRFGARGRGGKSTLDQYVNEELTGTAAQGIGIQLGDAIAKAGQKRKKGAHL